MAVNGADAMPELLVAKVIAVDELLNFPLAPLPGAVNVTLTPGTELFPASFTVTARALPKGVLVPAVCGVVPAFAVMLLGIPTVLVNEKLTVVSPEDAAVTMYGPVVPLAVNGADAMPDAFVATEIAVDELLNVPLAPLPGAVNVTSTPDTGLLPASFTVTASAVNGALMAALCGVVPEFADMLLADPGVLVSKKFTVVSPDDDAVTVYGPPAVKLAVNGAAATPELLVATVIVVVEVPNNPLAPLPGAVNVTFTFGTGLLPASVTVTASGFANEVLIGVLCGVVPVFAVMLAGVAAVANTVTLTLAMKGELQSSIASPPNTVT